MTRAATIRVTTALGAGSGALVYRYHGDHAGDLRWTEEILDQPAHGVYSTGIEKASWGHDVREGGLLDGQTTAADQSGPRPAGAAAGLVCSGHVS